MPSLHRYARAVIFWNSEAVIIKLLFLTTILPENCPSKVRKNRCSWFNYHQSSLPLPCSIIWIELLGSRTWFTNMDYERKLLKSTRAFYWCFLMILKRAWVVSSSRIRIFCLQFWRLWVKTWLKLRNDVTHKMLNQKQWPKILALDDICMNTVFWTTIYCIEFTGCP